MVGEQIQEVRQRVALAMALVRGDNSPVDHLRLLYARDAAALLDHADGLAAELGHLRDIEADAARVIHDLRGESAAYEQGRADMLGEVVRLLEARSQAGWIIVDSHVIPNVRALGDAAPPLPPDLVRAENERLRDALRDLVAASCNEMASRGLPVEYRPDTPLGRAVSALGEEPP